MTTTLIFLMTLRSRMKNQNETNKYILNGKNYRLIPSYLDRPAFYSMIDKTESSCYPEGVRNIVQGVMGISFFCSSVVAVLDGFIN